jgi:hypothetical protein
VSQLESSVSPVLFHKLPISDEPFTWRGRSWVKTSQNHATLISGSPEADSEHIPSHDVVEMLEVPP